MESVQVFISAVGKQTETFVLCNIYSYVQVPTHELDVKVFCFFFFSIYNTMQFMRSCLYYDYTKLCLNQG